LLFVLGFLVICRILHAFIALQDDINQILIVFS
jgi:hypothetical protein